MHRQERLGEFFLLYSQASLGPEPEKLADAIRKTNITDNVSTGPGIQFNEKGQNDKLEITAIQNRDGKLPAVAPTSAASAKVNWPMTPYDKH